MYRNTKRYLNNMVLLITAEIPADTLFCGDTYGKNQRNDGCNGSCSRSREPVLRDIPPMVDFIKPNEIEAGADCRGKGNR